MREHGIRTFGAQEARGHAFRPLDSHRWRDFRIGEISPPTLARTISCRAVRPRPEQDLGSRGLRLPARTQNGGRGDGQKGVSTAKVTERAALLLHPESGLYHHEVERSTGWLLDRLRNDGGWDTRPVALTCSNAFYTLTHPLTALPRYQRSKLAR